MAKKSIIRFQMQSFDDDEGYGASPPAFSLQTRKNVFTFAESSTVAKSHVKTATEDEWSLLASELNQVLNFQPASAVTRKKNCTTKLNNFSYTSVPPPQPNNFSYTSVQPPKYKNYLHTSVTPPKYKDADAGPRPRKVHCQFCAKNGEVLKVVRIILCLNLKVYFPISNQLRFEFTNS